MSNRIYSYLSDKIISYFKNTNPLPGDKFYVQFETDDQVRNLYDELSRNTIAENFVYEDIARSQKYQSYQLKFGDCYLIVAAALVGGPHPDFLAQLRNMVGRDSGYENKAILFIHYSSLDSILGGAGSLSKDGMPLNINAIKKDINRKIQETGFGKVDKQILLQYLKNKSNEFEGVAVSVFEYEDIIEVLGNSQITAAEYRTFELFPDRKLEGLTDRNLINRLNENHANYVRISEIHSYGLDEARLERYYGEDGAKKLAKSDWQNLTYPEIEKFIESKKNKTIIDYFPIESNMFIWDREEGDTRAKSRIRNIIIFYNGNDEEYKFDLAFSEFTRKDNISISKNYESVIECISAGKKLQVTLKKVLEQSSFYEVKYVDDGTRFDFKIAVLRCDVSLLDGIKTQYIVEIGKKPEDSSIRINSDDDIVTFYPNNEQLKKIEITELNQVIVFNHGERVEVKISDDFQTTEDTDDINFSISIGAFDLNLTKVYVVEKPIVIEGMKLWYMKNTKRMNFEFINDNSLCFGTKRFFTRGEFRRSLVLEKAFIRNGAPFVSVNSEDIIKSIDIELPRDVQSSFDAIIDYFKRNNQLPSLVFINDELKQLYLNYINSVLVEIGSIQEGEYLSELQKNLFYLGMIKNIAGDKEIFLTPLHPINIAYQLLICETNIDGIEEGEDDLIRKFQSTALFPYINIDPVSKENNIFVPVEQLHSPEWKIYVEEDLRRYKGSKDFVSKLVAEKIREFIEHFSYLFASSTHAPVRINLINTGDCREIVQGIVQFYVKALNNKRHVMPILVTMYAKEKMDNSFEIMSKVDDADELSQLLGLKLQVGDMSTDEVIDVYRNNVHFYYKDIQEKLDYAHITFMEQDGDNQAVTTQMSDMPSGVVMNGLSSGVSSALLGDSYRTGFGTKYIEANTTLLKIVVDYNSLNAAMNGDAYRHGTSETLKMSPSKEQMLDRVYSASNWVTFINPKVDLNYFKSDPNAKDLMIIHYSDQYNLTSSGYDAITVTMKSKQYQDTISRYLKKNGVNEADSHAKNIINMFNALNGDWLLRMLSYKSHFPVEKLSILSAMKLAVKRYSIDDVIWVPISLEEILRVSGAVGLSRNEAIFSAKNLGFDGATSDDLLLVGISNRNGVKVTFYPIEVKIGHVESGYLEKGVHQAKKTRQIFDQILEKGYCKDKSIKTRLYRNFFMQQVMINAEKMLMYGVGDGNQGWNLIVDSLLRKDLLSENYEIVDTLIPEMGRTGVVSFKDDNTQEREHRYEDVLIIEKSKKEGVNLLALPFSKIDTVKWELVQDVTELEDMQDTGEDENVDVEDNENNDEAPILKTEINDEKSEQTKMGISDTNKDIRVLIGKDKFQHDIYWEFGNKALANRHLLITGTSGQGKTYSIQTMLYELAKRNISSVIFDYTEGFMLQQLEQPFRESLEGKIDQKIVYSMGVPINPFKRHEVDLAGTKILEKESDVAARLSDIFSHVYDFGAQQNAAIFEAVYNGLISYGNNMNMRYFQHELETVAETNKAANTVISKMLPFFRTADFTDDSEFDWGDILYNNDGKVEIIQLTQFSNEIKIIIAEMMLWDAWYYTKKYGSKDKPFVVVLDEAQNLSHNIKSPSAAILTEGRKFGWSAWFATQSLKVLKEEEIVRLLQASFKLYFKPTDIEIGKIAKQIDVTGEGNWLGVIQGLQKGQCIVTGDRMLANGKVGASNPVVTNITAFEKRQ